MAAGRPTGRPSKYSEELADKICEATSTSSKSLKTIVTENEGFPGVSTVLQWLADGKHQSFTEKYARAKQEQADYMAEEILEIADDGTNDYMTITKGDKEYNVENKEVTNRSRLRIDARKWLASKLKPKKYGEKIEMEHSVNTKQTFKIGDQEIEL